MSTMRSSSSRRVCRGSDIGRSTIGEPAPGDAPPSPAGDGVCPQCQAPEPAQRVERAHSFAHALRGPIRQLGSLTQLLRQPGLPASVLERTEGHLDAATARAAAILDRFVALTDVECAVLRDVDVDLDRLPDDGLERVFHGPTLARADPSLVSLVFRELQANSLQAGATRMVVRTTVEAGHLRLSVTDDGTGPPADVVARDLLRPFRSLSGRAGVGLNLVDAACRRYGGGVDVQHCDDGLVVTFELPTAE